MFELLLLIQNMTCFLSSKHESEIIAMIDTFLDDIHVGCKKGGLASFSQSLLRPF